jgi:uncharacterized protein YcfJ
MKHLLSTISLATVLAISSSASIAKGHKHHDKHRDFQDTARVTHVEPLYKTIRVSTPQHECRTERAYRHDRPQARSYTSTIAGGIVGGLIGNQFGGGGGKIVMTVAGTLLGGSLGNDYNNYRTQTRKNYGSHENCRVTKRYTQEQVRDGYEVSYRYQGNSYTTYMDERPGKHIPVEVSVRPAYRYY